MRQVAIWVLAGVVAGSMSGALLGWPNVLVYMLGGAGIGAAAGLGIAVGLRISAGR